MHIKKNAGLFFRFFCIGILLIVTLNAQVPTHGFHPDYVYKIWDNKNGLPQNTVSDIVKDEGGYLWIATDEGLLHFDGNDFTLINEENTPDLFSNSFYDLCKSPKQGVWAASGNTLLHLYKNTHETFDFRQYVQGGWITSVAEDRSGTVWVGTNTGGLFYLQNNRITRFKGWLYEGAKSIQQLQLVSSGVMIATDKGLFRLTDTDKKQIMPVAGFENVDIRVIAEDHDTSLWMGTKENGLYHIKNDLRFHFTKKEGLTDLHIKSLAVAPDGTLWIGTATSGIQSYAHNQFSSVSEKTFFNQGIKSILFTEPNLAWVGTIASGLVQMKVAEVQMLSKDSGLSGNVILAIYQHSNGDKWIGTAGEGVNLISKGKIRHYRQQDGLSNEIILSIYGTKDFIYIGTVNGLNRLNIQTGKIDKHYGVKDGLASNVIQSVFEDSGQRLWIATRSGGIHTIENGKIKRIALSDTFSKTEFTAIFEDHNKNIWFGSIGSGIVCINKNGGIRHYQVNKGISSDMVYSFYEDHDGGMWFGTEAGLLAFVNNRFILFNKSNGLKFNGLYRIIEDDLGFIWLSGTFGLQRISLAELASLKNSKNKSTQIAVKLFDTSEGMTNAETNGNVFPAGWKMRDGSLWFPTVDGIARVQPMLITHNNNPVNIHIQSIQFGNKRQTVMKGIRIPPNVYTISIQYAGIDFIQPKAIKYYYRLKGLSNEWENAGNRRIAYFTLLAPGDYVFEVKAEQNGQWSEPDLLPFTVEPFFYQTIWFKALLLLLLFAGGFFVNKLYSQYRNEAKLRILVDERTQELKKLSAYLQNVREEERKYIAKEVHDELGQLASALKIDIDWLNIKIVNLEENVKMRIAHINKTLEVLITSIRKIASSLRPSVLDDFGLNAALQWHCTEFQNLNDIPCHFEAGFNDKDLTMDRKTELYRIAQESLTNVMRHAGATKVSVTTKEDAANIYLTIADNGKGFDISQRKNTLGLIGLRERALSVKGELSIDSVPGKGTTISVVVPK